MRGTVKSFEDALNNVIIKVMYPINITASVTRLITRLSFLVISYSIISIITLLS